MRTLILTTAVVLFSTAATFAQDKATPAKATAPMTMSADDITDAQRKLSGELKNSLGLTEKLIRQAKALATEAKPEQAEKYVKTVESLSAIQARLNDQLTVVNKATPADSKEIFEKGMEVNTSVNEQLESYKTELMPEGK